MDFPCSAFFSRIFLALIAMSGFSMLCFLCPNFPGSEYYVWTFLAQLSMPWFPCSALPGFSLHYSAHISLLCLLCPDFLLVLCPKFPCSALLGFVLLHGFFYSQMSRNSLFFLLCTDFLTLLSMHGFLYSAFYARISLLCFQRPDFLAQFSPYVLIFLRPDFPCSALFRFPYSTMSRFCLLLFSCMDFLALLSMPRFP